MEKQKREQKLIKISSIKIDLNLYPRNAVDWTTCAKYYNALKSGAVFPPILVAKKGLKYILIDGGHRLKAHKDFKDTYIQAEIVKGWTNEQIYTEAVKLNSQHGRNFSTQEITKIILTLEKWGKSKQEISKLVSIPAKELQKFVAKRISFNTAGGSEVLKAPLKHLAGTHQNNDIENEEDCLSANGQIQILDNFLTMLENNWFNLNGSAQVRVKLKKIYKLLIPLFVKGK